MPATGAQRDDAAVVAGGGELDVLVWDAPNIDMTLSTVIGARPSPASRPRFDAIGRWFVAAAGERHAEGCGNRSRPRTRSGSRPAPAPCAMRSGEVVTVDFGVPAGSEPGFVRPAVVVTADAVLAGRPRTIHVVPLTSNLERRLSTEVVVEPVGRDQSSAAQCHLCSVVSHERVTELGAGASIGPVALAQVRSVLADLLDIG